MTGDEVRLRQVVGNLMANALTHTPAGHAGPGPRRVPRAPPPFLEVVDKGPGLAPDQAQRVFERFYRADPARSRTADALATPPGTADEVSTNGTGLPPSGGGTGLGLAIVAGLVAAHRGTVTVQTSPGAGATFRVSLPLSLTCSRRHRDPRPRRADRVTGWFRRPSIGASATLRS